MARQVTKSTIARLRKSLKDRENVFMKLHSYDEDGDDLVVFALGMSVYECFVSELLAQVPEVKVYLYPEVPEKNSEIVT